MRRSLTIVTTALVALALTVFAITALHRTPTHEGQAGQAGVVADTTPVLASATDQLTKSIAVAQTHLRAQPKDSGTWAALGLAYVAQARLTADPTYYPKAEAAVARSFEEKPTDNADAEGVAGALKAARHDFSGALASADRALALDPYSSQAQNVRTDALVELGRYDEAMKSAKLADDRHAGTPSVTRLSYLAELHGNIPEAKRLMELGVEDSADPTDVAFAQTQLGLLSRTAGNLDEAAKDFSGALAADPGYLPARAATASLDAARGKTEEALTIYADVTGRLPLAEYLSAYGELLQSLGRTDEAQQQYDVLQASVALAKSNGVYADLDLAHFEADHGSAAQALVAAQSEWSRRHSILAADAMGWAMHALGRDKEALPYAMSATRLGTKDPRLLYHRGMIQLATGDRAAARQSLTAALTIDPHFSPIAVPRARAALAGLGAA